MNSRITLSAALLALALPLGAQRTQHDSKDPSKQYYSQGSSKHGMQSQSMSRNQNRSGSNTQRSSQRQEWQSTRPSNDRTSSNLRVDPIGWTAIAYDFDDDGLYDAYEYIYSYDLETARTRSKQRAQQEGRQTEAGWRQNRQGQQFRGQQPSRPRETRFGQPRSGSFQRGAQVRTQRAGFGRSTATFSVQGAIAELKQIGLAGMQQPHAIAEVRTNDGQTTRVDLGPKSGIESLDLKSGDTLRVVGMPGHINDRRVLMAARVEHDGQTIDVQRPDDKQLTRYEGRIVDIRTVAFQALNEEHVVAQVELRDGRTVPVDLGSVSQVRNAPLQPGVSIDFLADRVSVDDRHSLRADRFRLNGRTFEIDREMEKEQLRRQSGMGGQSSSMWQSSNR